MQLHAPGEWIVDALAESTPHWQRNFSSSRVRGSCAPLDQFATPKNRRYHDCAIRWGTWPFLGAFLHGAHWQAPC
jgi:hypothetical protein